MSQVEIELAKTAGFCFGVRRAVKMAGEAARQYGGCACLGPLIHNNDVVRRLEEQGVRTVKSVSQLVPGEPVIIRSHGVGPEVYRQIQALGCPVIDATCPEVARIHGPGRLVRRLYRAGKPGGDGKMAPGTPGNGRNTPYRGLSDHRRTKKF